MLHTARRLSLIATFAAAGVAGCRTGPKAALDPKRAPDAVEAGCATPGFCSETVTVRSLGVGGFVVRYGGAAVMTPPLFSRGGRYRVALGYELLARPLAVDSALKAMNESLSDVSMVLVGHAHYDHLMDLPHIINWYLPHGVKIVGSATMKHLLHPIERATDSFVVVTDADAGTPYSQGKWIYSADRRVRAMALRSTHPPNVKNPLKWPKLMIGPGKIEGDRDTFPRTAWGWKLGDVYAFVVDFMEKGKPVFRFIYHDAPPDASLNGLPEFDEENRHDVNVFIICAGNFDMVHDYPRAALKAVSPARVIVGHWEDFFRHWKDTTRVIPYLRTERLAASLDSFGKGLWTTPEPGAVMKFAFSK